MPSSSPAALALAALSALPILAFAIPTPSPDPSANGGSPQSCNTAPIQCCNDVVPAGSATIAPLLGVLGVVIQDLNLPIGITCSGINGVGVGSGDACSAVTVCCENNSYGGLISIGCIPIIL